MKLFLNNTLPAKILATEYTLGEGEGEDSRSFVRNSLAELSREFKMVRQGNTWYSGSIRIRDGVDWREATVQDLETYIYPRMLTGRSQMVCNSSVSGIYFVLQAEQKHGTNSCVCGGLKTNLICSDQFQTPSYLRIMFGGVKRNKVAKHLNTVLTCYGADVLELLKEIEADNESCADDENYSLLP